MVIPDAVEAEVAVVAFPDKAPANVVAVRVPVEGTKLRPVLLVFTA